MASNAPLNGRLKAAVLRGLHFIFELAQDSQAFADFGGDMIQSFYDVATVGEEPVRHQALKYVEVTAQWWKARNVSLGDISSGGGRKLKPQQLLAAVQGVYALERLGIASDLKQHLQRHVAAERAASPSGVAPTAQYLKWDPKSQSPHDAQRACAARG